MRWRRQLHFLKGSALNLGLRELAAICQDGERKAAPGHAAVVDMVAVAAIYRASREALLDGVASGRLARPRRLPAQIRNSDSASSLVMSRIGEGRPHPSGR